MTLKEEFDAALTVLREEADGWMNRVGELLAARPGWTLDGGDWTHTEFGPDRMAHTRRTVGVRRVSRGDRPMRFEPSVEDFLPRFVIRAEKATGSGTPTDEADYEGGGTGPDDAVAWVLEPRSDTTISERHRAQAERALANADKVSIAGLAGRRVDFGRTAKREWYTVVEIDGVGRVRYTALDGGRWRVSIGRRRLVVSAPEGDKAAAAVAVRDAIIALDKEIASASVNAAIRAATCGNTP